MGSVQEHYENLLARHYTWMFGGFASMVASNAALLDRLGIVPEATGRAVDLGAGSGFQSIVLAMRGFKVTAVDTSPVLLDELRANTGAWPIEAVEGDMLDVRGLVEPGLELAVCMGDSLTHLPSRDVVEGLFRDLQDLLTPGGRLILSWRDLTQPLEGVDRFIPVKADDSAIFTCFLEYHSDHVRVHDLVYTKAGDAWRLNKSSYPKLRLGRAWVAEALENAGFTVLAEDEERGQAVIVARTAFA